MYDPNIPANGTDMVSAEMRSQFQGLKSLIDALPNITGVAMDGVTTLNPGDLASVSLSVSGGVLHFSFGIPRGDLGQAGQDGASAAPITSFVVDGVSTLNPGDNASVQATFDGSSVRFVFGIPRGNDGTPGQIGQDGQTGSQGVQGPPFAMAVVDGVSTLNPGDNATVQTNFDGSNVHFSFGIPRGNDGGTGAQGAPGEVSLMQLSSAVGGTSSNSNGVGTLGMTVSDPPTQGEVQAIASKLDELIVALRR